MDAYQHINNVAFLGYFEMARVNLFFEHPTHDEKTGMRRGLVVHSHDIHYKRSVVYDMWDEIYTVKTCDACKPVKVKSPAEALKLLATIDDEPVAKLADIPTGEDSIYYLAIRADLNPVSKETMAEVRRWLSQGTGGGLDRGSVFFGNFVSVFVNPKIAEADRVLRVRSQPFYRPK